jgi:hypothetical protein
MATAAPGGVRVRPRAVGLYASALRLYPRSHRDEYGADMVQLFADRYRDERPGGDFFRFMRFWGGIVGDVLRTALAERTESVMSSLKQNWWKWLIGAGAVFQGMFLVEAGFALAFGHENKSTIGAALTVAVFAATVLALVIGLRLLSSKPRMASYLLTFGLLPIALAGVMFFWFPPMYLASVLGTYLIVRVFMEAGRITRNEVAPA